MSVVVIITLALDRAALENFEAAHPEFADSIGGPIRTHVTSVRRVERDGEVVEIEEFPSQAAYDAFLAEAAPAIEKYDRMLGAAVVVRVYRSFD